MMNTKDSLEEIAKHFEGLKKKLGHVLPSHTILPSAVLMLDTLMAFLSLFIALYLRIGDEFLEFMKNWFDNHCTNYDRGYVKCFKEHGLK